MPAGDAIRVAADNVEAAAADIQTAVESVVNGSVSFEQVKTVLTGLGAAIAPQCGASSAMASLLIDQSNFSGEDQ